MNEKIQEEQLLKSMKLYSLTNQQNNLNPLQFISTPNLEDFKKENKLKGNNNENLRNLNINNEINNNNLNISDNELFNFELDQSTTSIITNQSVSHQFPIENSPKKNSKNKDNLIDHNFFHSVDIGEKAQNLNNNYSSNDILKYKEMIKTLGEKLKNEYLINKEQNNYIEILKHTINNYLLKNENSKIINLDKASKELNKNQIDILTELTSAKTENEKIKKQQVMQQILYDDIKNEITNLTKENNNLKASYEKVIKENKSLKNIKEELSHNYDMLLSESEEIKNTLLKYEEEFTNCQKNNSDYIRLKSVNSELSANYEKQKNALMNLQNDFNTVNKSNNELKKYNEKLEKENQQLKKDLFLKSNELENISNKMNNNIKDFKENNDVLIKEKNEMINNMKDIENKNVELCKIKENQKIEIDSLNKIINDKNNEILKYMNEIQYLKNNNVYNNINNACYNNKEKLSSEINLDLIINNIQNELKEKNKLIEDLKTQNAKLIKENDYREELIQEYIKKENSKKKDINNDDKIYSEKIDKLNIIIKQKELEIYSYKNNEKSYNKIADLSFKSIKEFASKIKNYDEFRVNSPENQNYEMSDNNENNLFIKPLKEFVFKMNEYNEDNKNFNNYYNGNNIPLIEKIKKINTFTNLMPIEIDILYSKIKTIQQENKVLLNIKNKSKNINTNKTIKNTEEEEIHNFNITDDNNNLSLISSSKDNIINNNQSNLSILDNDNYFENLKRYVDNNNNKINIDNGTITIDANYLENKAKNIENIKSKISIRNNILQTNYNYLGNINNNLTNNFDENNLAYKTISDTLNRKDKEKFNLKLKERNNNIFNNRAPKSLIFNEEDNVENFREKKNLKDEIPHHNKNNKKSRITLFKEEIINRNALNDTGNNKNIFLSFQNNPKILTEKIMNKKNSNFSNVSSHVSRKNSNNSSNNVNFMNNNISLSNRANQSTIPKNNTKNQKIFFHNRNVNKKIIEELNISNVSKNIVNSYTIDSSRFNNNIVPSVNDNAIFKKKKKNEEKNKNNDLYQKSINGLAEEVMKPSFLKSDVSLTMYGGGLSINNSNKDSFLFLTRNKLNKKDKKNDSNSFIDIKSNSRRNLSPFNNSSGKNGNNVSYLQRNKSFLY